MRKFKHKQTNSIVEQDLSNKGFYRDIFTNGIIAGKYIENTNDWEEIIEKDYEILSFKSNRTNQIDDFQTNHAFLDEECYLKNEFWDIYSIRRKSDNEIFTVGDKIQSEYFIPYNEIRTIQRFKIISNTIDVEQDRGITNLNDIKKVKKPLFTTKDGIDIFEKEEFWFLNKNLNYPPNKSKNYCNDSHVLYFSSKEAAEEHILMNKPCLSLRDLEIAYKDFSVLNMKYFEKLVKQRL